MMRKNRPFPDWLILGCLLVLGLAFGRSASGASGVLPAPYYTSIDYMLIFAGPIGFFGLPYSWLETIGEKGSSAGARSLAGPAEKTLFQPAMAAASSSLQQASLAASGPQPLNIPGGNPPVSPYATPPVLIKPLPPHHIFTTPPPPSL
jgi:hypothetical protein